MRKSITLGMLLLAASTAFAADEPPAAAMPEKTSFTAGLAGIGLITSTGGGNNFAWAVRSGFGVGRSNNEIHSLGVYIGGMSDSDSVGAVFVNTRTTAVLLEYVGRRAWGSNFYMGGRAGIGLGSANIAAGGNVYSASLNSFSFAPVIGVEAPLGSGPASLVFDVSWITVLGGTLTFPGLGSIKVDASQAVVLSAGLLVNW
jgi:hypothetical protein